MHTKTVNMLNFKYIKDRSAPGSWRRGYEYHQKGQVKEALLDGNIVKGKVKGNFKDHYSTEISYNENQITAKCDCPLEEEWCKHAVSVALYSIDKHLFDPYLKENYNLDLEHADENPSPIESPQGGYIFKFNPTRRQRFASVKITDRSTGKTVSNIEKILKSIIEIQKHAPENFKLTKAQKNELVLLQELYKLSKFDKKSKYFDFPFNKLDKIFKLFREVEEVVDHKTGQRIEFKNEIWKLILTVNVSVVGNVLLSLHWSRPDPEDTYPLEEVRYFSRGLKWMRYKNIIIQTDTALSVLPHYLIKSTFTDIRDADGGKFVYEEVPQLKKLMTVDISETLEELTLERRPPSNIVTMALDEDFSIKASLDFEYDGITVPYGKLAEKSPYVTVKKPKKDLIYWIKRDLKHEESCYNMLLACKFTPLQTNNLLLDSNDTIDFYNYYKDQAGKDWKFKEMSDFSKLKIAASPLKIHAKIDFSESVDSFDIELFCGVARKKIDIDDVFNHLHKGIKYIHVPGKGFAEIPAAKLVMFNKTLQSFDAIKKEERSYSIKTFRAGLVAELIEQEIEITMSPKFEKFWTHISTFDTPEVELPTTINADLREYQQKGLNWLWFLYKYGLNGILADDMGLGKTLQTLALIQKAKDQNGQKPTLVVCPTSVVFNWEAEVEKFAPELTTLNLTGAARKSSFKYIDEHDIILTSYALVRRDIKLLKKHEFRSVILDESQNIKNHESQTAQAVKEIKSIHKLALSGTPIENRLSELWSVFDFLMPEFLYDIDEFNYRYVTPIVDRGDKSIESRLKKQIYPFILRRLKRDVAKDLPDKVENVAYCNMTPEQREYYLDVLDSTREELLNNISQDGLEKSKMSVFAALLRLRQICCHPRLLDKDGSSGVETSGKFEHLKEMLEEIISEGHRILLFSQFTQMLDLVKEWLEKENVKYEYLTGATKNRKERVDNFNNNDSIPIFLISLKAGGTGLNLTGADYVIHYDPWWNPAVEDQATDRAYRIGQTKKVFVYRFITKGSVEEKIQKLKGRKRDLVDSVISVDRNIGKSLTYEDIKDILSPDL